MIVVDSSAFIAILTEKPDRTAFMAAIAGVERRLTSALTVLETRMVMRGRHGMTGVADFDRLLDDIDAEIVPFDAAQALAAFDAIARWGNGIHPQARLDMGDCVAYALAESLSSPLLFKGDDFAATDSVAAV